MALQPANPSVDWDRVREACQSLGEYGPHAAHFLVLLHGAWADTTHLAMDPGRRVQGAEHLARSADVALARLAEAVAHVIHVRHSCDFTRPSEGPGVPRGPAVRPAPHLEQGVPGPPESAAPPAPAPAPPHAPAGHHETQRGKKA